MNDVWTSYATALVLGAAHALEVDHMVAVTAFVGSEPRLRPAVSFGVRWGLGHSLTVLVVGGLLAWSGVRWPATLVPWSEMLVGVALVGVGAWVIVNTRRLHYHGAETHGGHAHLHAHRAGSRAHQHRHRADPSKRHRHLSTVVGSIHGLAGAAPAVALVPVTMISSLPRAMGYLLMFGAGTVAGMAVYSGLAAIAASKVERALAAGRRVAVAAGGMSILVGLTWMVRALPS